MIRGVQYIICVLTLEKLVQTKINSCSRNIRGTQNSVPFHLSLTNAILPPSYALRNVIKYLENQQLLYSRAMRYIERNYYRRKVY